MTTSTVSQTVKDKKDEAPEETVEHDGITYIYRPCVTYQSEHDPHVWHSAIKNKDVWCKGEWLDSATYHKICGFTSTTWVAKKKHNYVDTVKDNGSPWRIDYDTPITVTEARAIAYHMHKDDVDKSGEAYKLHLHAVEQGVIVLGGNDEERIAALFHDAVEDAHATLEHLKEIGCTERTVAIIEAVSKRTSEEQSKYLARIIEQGHGACRVKVADLLHNTRHDRMESVAKAKGTYTRDRLLKKYRPALASLMLELTLIVDEDAQKKLATKPIGSSTGYTTGYYSGKGSTSGKGAGTNVTTGGTTRSMNLAVKTLIIGDWPIDWTAPITDADHGNGMTVFTLADGTVREEQWMSGSAERRVPTFSYNQWANHTAVVPCKGIHDDHYLDFMVTVEEAKEENGSSSTSSGSGSKQGTLDNDYDWGGWHGL